jgi:hypothetical protein
MKNLKETVKAIIEENGGQEFANDVMTHGCVSGVVTELITYSQTHEWFDTHYEDIMELVEEHEEMTGERVQHDGDLKNWFAWFSFESITFELYNN